MLIAELIGAIVVAHHWGGKIFSRTQQVVTDGQKGSIVATSGCQIRNDA